jgi:hypothetical protein
LINPELHLTKRGRKSIQINKIIDGEEDIKTNTNKIQRTVGGYFENLNSNKLENIEETDTFLDVYGLPKLTQEDINHLNRFVMSNEI